MNIVEFSAKAGVSTATVSRAFHEPDKLRAETCERILALAQKLGYYPSPSGRALKRGRYDVLGLVWPLEVEGAEAEFAQRILAALTRHLVEKDLDLLVCPVDRRQVATLAHARRTLQRSRCDAWILLYPRHDDALVRALEDSRKPVVCLMGELEECPMWKSVKLDQQSWMEDALKRCKAAGCQSVLLYGGREGEPDHEERRVVFSDLAPKYFGAAVTSISGASVDVERLRSQLASRPPDAIIGVDDRAALLVLELCRELKISIPKRVKLVGMDDIALSEYSTPSLSTYRQPLAEMVGCAVDLAVGGRSRSKLFKASFVGRESLP